MAPQLQNQPLNEAQPCQLPNQQSDEAVLQNFTFLILIHFLLDPTRPGFKNSILCHNKIMKFIAVLTLALVGVLGSTSYEPSDVAEPSYDVELKGSNYEVRSYSKRFAIEASSCNGTSGLFRKLAGFIGVIGKPQNDQDLAIPMTAPVSQSMGDDGCMRMQFFLPADFDDLSKIPTPTDSSVKVKEVPASYGAVYSFWWSWWYTLESSKGGYEALVKQLNDDGLDLTIEDTGYEFWAYNAPFNFWWRRNEVFVQLTDDQVQTLERQQAYASLSN